MVTRSGGLPIVPRNYLRRTFVYSVNVLLIDGCFYTYGARILAWSRRYKENELELHLPICLTTSNGIPRSKYSKVASILRLWLWENSMPAFSAVSLTLHRKIALVIGIKELWVLKEKRWLPGTGSLICKWMKRKHCESTLCFYAAQKTVSPFGVVLVQGIWNAVTLLK